MERGPPWEVKFFGGDWGFLGKIYVGTPPPPAAVPLPFQGRLWGS